MKTKLLLLAVLCASQCALPMVAGEAPRQEQSSKPAQSEFSVVFPGSAAHNGEIASVTPAEYKALVSFIRQRDEEYSCDFHAFKTSDKQAYEEHMKQHESMSARELSAYLHFIGINDYCVLAGGGETETLNGLVQLYSFNP